MEKLTDSRLEFPEEPTEEDALKFIQLVRKFFFLGAEEFKYDEFATALMDYRALKIRPEDVVRTAHKIFQGNRILFSEFKKFLPSLQETKTSTVSSTTMNDDPGNESKYQECKDYIEKVKARFENNPDVYSSFLAILTEHYGKGEDDMVKLCRKIFSLFMGHADLIAEFDNFLSDLSDDTRKKVEEIKIRTLEDHLEKVGKLLRKGEKAIEFVDRVYKFSNSVFENGNVDIHEQLKKKDLRCLEELYGEDSKFKKVLSKNPTRVLNVVNPRLKMQQEVMSMARSSKLEALKENHQAKRPRIG